MEDKVRMVASYLDGAFDPKEPRRIVRAMRKGTTEEVYEDGEWVKKHKEPLEFDTIVGTGLSGALLVPRIATTLKVDYMIVRKEGDGSHSGNLAEGTLGKRWVFFDDLIDGANTFNRVYSTVERIVTKHRDHQKYRLWNRPQANEFESTFVGAFLYNQSRTHTPEDMIEIWGERLCFHPEVIRRKEEERKEQELRIERERAARVNEHNKWYSMPIAGGSSIKYGTTQIWSAW